MLISALILAASLGLLVQFFVAYCRSLINAAYNLELSEQAHQVTGIDDHHIQPTDFRRMMDLLHLCPGPGTDRMQLGAVRVYFSILNFFRNIFGSQEWIHRDQKSCSYFVAVALDRRITHNRMILNGHSS